MPGNSLAEWSRAVRARDGRCMLCGSTDSLHAHHILPKATHPELMLCVENGKTLCYACHKKEHENNRLPRLRKEYRPHRKTLERRIDQLEDEVRKLKAANKRLTSKVNECTRGSCASSLALLRKHQFTEAT